MLASIAAAASALRSPNGGGLLPPSSVGAAHHPYLASAFSSALGGLSALTSGLTGNGGAHGSGQHPPLTPSPSSDSPQQMSDAPRAPNSSQQSWTFEEQFKQVSAASIIDIYFSAVLLLKTLEAFISFYFNDDCFFPPLFYSFLP